MRILAIAVCVVIGACAPVAGPTVSPAGQTLGAEAIAAILSDPARPEADRASDSRRKTADVLALLDLRPGQHVIDIEAGAGYWTELLSRAVGPGGQVVMQNPQGFVAFVGPQIERRLADGRLANVRQHISNFDQLGEASARFDRAVWVQGPHEVFYRPEGVSLGEPEGSAHDVARVLKPGGLLLVIDHSALPGAPTATGHDLHRIDPVVTIGLLTAAGLRLETRSEILANPADPRTASAFDPSIRGRTDQHVLVFRKPG